MRFVATYVVQHNQGLGPTSLMVADGEEDALADNGREQLLNEQSQEDCADSGQVEVVDDEESLQLKRLSLAHHLASTKDYYVVDDDEDGGLLQRRHGRAAGLEAEVVGGIAHDELEGLVEDRP